MPFLSNETLDKLCGILKNNKNLLRYVHFALTGFSVAKQLHKVKAVGQIRQVNQSICIVYSLNNYQLAIDIVNFQACVA